MRIIQTFWSQNEIEIKYNRGGWLSNESNIMCWALSCLNAKKIYGNIELYTDNAGYELLINQLHLPYDKVHLVFDNSIMNSIPKELWALSKIYTYSLQNEPFIHIDGDFIFWDKIDIEKDILFQNLEIGLDFYQDTYVLFSKNRHVFKKCNFTKCIDIPFIGSAANLGIFGGFNVSFIKEYAKDVLEFIAMNIDYKDIFISEAKNVNCFLEQYYLYFLCKERDAFCETVHPSIFMEPEKNKNKYYDIPDVFNLFNHFLGNSKKTEIVNDFVKWKLLEFHQDFYYKIKKILNNNYSFEYYYINKKNSSVDLDAVNKNFDKNLAKFNLTLSDELMLEFNECWKLKLELLQRCNEIQTVNLTNVQKNNSLNSSDDFLVRLTNNFITIRKYRLPWDMLFLSDKYFNPEMSQGQLKQISESNLTKPSVYCVFSYTPFEPSISSFWITDINAYILSKVLSFEYQTLSDIISKIQILLSKESELSYEIIKNILIKFILKIKCYEIIETKTYTDSINVTDNDTTNVDVTNERNYC
jgi:hypothetical protein